MGEGYEILGGGLRSGAGGEAADGRGRRSGVRRTEGRNPKVRGGQIDREGVNTNILVSRENNN